jgi:hypothetical protein
MRHGTVLPCTSLSEKSLVEAPPVGLQLNSGLQRAWHPPCGHLDVLAQLEAQRSQRLRAGVQVQLGLSGLGLARHRALELRTKLCQQDAWSCRMLAKCGVVMLLVATWGDNEQRALV